MTKDNLDEMTFSEKADAAVQESMKKVIKKAKETNTPIVISEDDQVKKIPVAKFVKHRGDWI